MDLKITITLSDQLFKLLEDKLPDLGKRVERALKKQINSEVKSQSLVEIQPSASPVQPVSPVENANQAAPAAEPDVPTYANVLEKIADKFGVSSITVTDLNKPIKERIREIIDATRLRVHGEEVDKFRPMFNRHMRQLAKCVGFEKPTDIDNEKAYDEFVHRCNTLSFDGEKYEQTAPF